MKARIRRQLSFANVTSLMALVFAMGGTGYALTIPRNSVGTSQIKKGGVASSDVRTNAVTGAKVKNRSLLAADFALGQLPTGAAGAAGATGAAGPTGPQGPTGVVGAITVQRDDVPLPDGTSAGAQVECPAGSKIVGGGSSIDASTSTDVHQTVSRPFRVVPGVDGSQPADGETFDSWRANWVNPIGGTPAATMRIFAVCVET